MLGRLILRGEIRWCSFDPPNKKRPVLILTRNLGLKLLNDVTIAPLTRTIRGIPTEVIVGPEDGLQSKSVISLDHLQTISKDDIGAWITTLSDEKLQDVQEAILFALGFSN